MRAFGTTGNAVPDTRGVPLPTATARFTHVLDRPRRDPLATSPFAGKTLPEFTPEQLQRAGYSAPRAAAAKTKRTGTRRTTSGAPAAQRHTSDPRRLTDDERQQIAQAYRAGATVVGIGRDIGRTPQAVRKALRDLGIEIDSTRRAHHLTDAQAAQAVRLRRDGATIEDVATQVGAPIATVTRALRPYGLAGTRVRASAFDHDQAVADYLAGASSTEVARKHGVSGGSVLNAVRAAGHLPRPPAYHQPRRDRTGVETRIVHAYTVDRLTVADVATTLRVSKKTVRDTLAAHRIPRRDDRSRSGGRNRTPDPLVRAAGELYLTGLTKTEVAERLGVGIKVVDNGIRLVGAQPRPAAHIAGALPGRDTLGGLRDLMHANDVTAADVRAWARDTGRPCPDRGLPARVLVEDYLLNRRPDTATA